MKFLSDLFEDVVETTEKIVKSPMRIICGVDQHDWVQQDGTLRCITCGKTTRPKR